MFHVILIQPMFCSTLGNPHLAAHQAYLTTQAGQLPYGYYAYQANMLPQGGLYPTFTTPSVYQVSWMKIFCQNFFIMKMKFLSFVYPWFSFTRQHVKLLFTSKNARIPNSLYQCMISYWYLSLKEICSNLDSGTVCKKAVILEQFVGAESPHD